MMNTRLHIENYAEMPPELSRDEMSRIQGGEGANFLPRVGKEVVTLAAEYMTPPVYVREIP